MLTTLIFNDAEIPDSLAGPLDELIALCFGGMHLNDAPPVTLRAVLLNGEQLIAHAAAQVRIFSLAGGVLPGYVLGLLCSHPAARQKGMGTVVTKALLEKLDATLGKFVVLNCGESVTGFYEKMGFERVADSAEYIRNGRCEIDLDPVFALRVAKDFDLCLLRTNPFHLGEDF